MKLGFVGLGQMGRPIALNLLKGGELRVVSRSDRAFGEFAARGARCMRTWKTMPRPRPAPKR